MTIEPGPHETLDTLSTAGIRILQPRRGYRYSLDSLILAFFLHLKKGDAVVELGAGAGVISMILAKRDPACPIVGLEIQKRLYGLMARNLALNGLEGRVQAVHGDIRRIEEYFDPAKTDAVCSNPPFRKVRSGRMNPDPEKAIARHEIELTLPDLIHAAAYLLKRHGKFSLIYLPERLADLIQQLRQDHLEPRRMQTIHSFPETPPVLVMVEAVKGAGAGMRMEAPFIIYRDKTGAYSKEMKSIYGFQSGS
ncbi:MAG: SAM-dependent methyltransferase [Nitrospirae bacterium CG_4_9_14_3_um_filter_53_35]|nr:MAG: hypothetical protein AUK29_03245 [Nitrospirae bacterium CG2_30_53_67]PIS36496.1 MAG: SAM-dependent methyltransferase [Nitrospirae bacterium CG08_land_8_20_14_0_20_52_24]PIW85561.1 MAG: SAM-dependent methyltransferase [Nitrospirae bacterium CG_4_8_14_3_um_filter_50_41]PIX86465.1 MAG: SAM-dependent methyltransferase [Nitrospirae bacterium CG_4_10_14_3_um_filter_53_41]PJA72836.1 MAG: SAM-dependent methyltransferase [Nitrospirae bacterium CG_4_9_14_3_um_filter_53_35]